MDYGFTSHIPISRVLINYDSELVVLRSCYFIVLRSRYFFVLLIFPCNCLVVVNGFYLLNLKIPNRFSES